MIAGMRGVLRFLIDGAITLAVAATLMGIYDTVARWIQTYGL